MKSAGGGERVAAVAESMSGALMWRVGPVPSMPRLHATPTRHARTLRAHAPLGEESVRCRSREILIRSGWPLAQGKCSRHVERAHRTVKLARQWGDHVTLELFAGRQLRELSIKSNRAGTTVGQVVVYTPPNVIAFTWAEDDWLAATDVSGQIRRYGTRTLARCELHREHRGWLAPPTNCLDPLMQAHSDG